LNKKKSILYKHIGNITHLYELRKEEMMNIKLLSYMCACSLVVAMLMFTACATTNRTTEIISTENFNSVEEITKLNDEITTARQAQVNALSPDTFAKAEKYYTAAKSSMENGYELSTIKKYIDKSRAALIQAKNSAEIAKETIPDVIEGRKTARAAGATKLGNDYTHVENLFLQLTRAVEKEDLSYAQKYKSKVLDGYWDLELRAIKESTIGETRKLIEAAREAGAPEILPNLYMQAEAKLNQTDQFISNNPYEKKTMAKMGDEALFLAKRTNILTRQAKTIEEMEPEDIALWMEDIIYQITEQMGAPDMRNQKFDTQVKNITGYAKNLNSERQILQDKVKSHQAQINAQKKRIVKLEAIAKEQQSASEKLAAERQAAERRLKVQERFNHLFEEVDSMFDMDEAEVYKEENKCVIRLRGIRFPVGQAVIMPENYDLLSKVQQAINKFIDPRVTIEGHTDSTGSNDVNELLSQQRAESVRQYLVGNGIVRDDIVVAVGYGSVRPLATNATEEGRAINRRIDVIVTPNQEAVQSHESAAKAEIN
jgi:outer membrane protein OmpA-like peptidoglycan-associated protein